MNERDQKPSEDATLRLVDAVLADWREEDRARDEALGAEFRARLLAGFDARQRGRRRGALASLAEAFGWSALSRPLAPAGILGALCAVGFTVGVAASQSQDEELVAALDLSFSYSMESDW